MTRWHYRSAYSTPAPACDLLWPKLWNCRANICAAKIKLMNEKRSAISLEFSRNVL